jgi:hypothetical protein
MSRSSLVVGDVGTPLLERHLVEVLVDGHVDDARGHLVGQPVVARDDVGDRLAPGERGQLGLGEGALVLLHAADLALHLVEVRLAHPGQRDALLAGLVDAELLVDGVRDAGSEVGLGRLPQLSTAPRKLVTTARAERSGHFLLGTCT